MTSTRDTSRDYARKNLFEWVDEDKLFERETYRSKFSNRFGDFGLSVCLQVHASTC